MNVAGVAAHPLHGRQARHLSVIGKMSRPDDPAARATHSRGHGGGASAGAQEDEVSESATATAAAAAWSAAGVRVAQSARGGGGSWADRYLWRCSGCVVGGSDRFDGDSSGWFIWARPALTRAGEARNAYCELAT